MSFSFSPHVIGEVRADFTSIESFLDFWKFRGKRNEELILAIYDYLTSTIDGSYHWWDMEENKGEPMTKGRVIDPVKLFNVYGFQICGQMATSLYRIYTTAGYPARVFGAPGHTISEVFYEDHWHFLDVDMWTWFKNKQNQIASAYELSQDAYALIVENTNKSNPCNLPDRKLDGYAKMFQELRVSDNDIDTVMPDYSVQGHTMDFHLRPGESVTRTVNALGYYHLPERFLPLIKKATLANTWKGHPRERYSPFRTYGNGLWSYEPNLTSLYSDFEEGVWSFENVRTTAEGLTGEGYAIFRIYSPYIFCGVPKIENDLIISSNGVFFSLENTGAVSVEISDAENNWVLLSEFKEGNSEAVDITDLLDGRYFCLIRLCLSPAAFVRKFKFEGRIMTAPMSIPRLVEGENQFSLRYNDRKNQPTVPYPMPIDFRENKGLEQSIVAMKNGEIRVERPGWLGIYPKELNQKVEVTFLFDLPAAKKSAWCYFYAVIKETIYGAPHGFASIEYSFNGVDWSLVSQRQISQTKLYWDCTLEGELVFAKPIEKIFFKIISDTNISGFHCYHHILESEHGGGLFITHQWEEEGVAKEVQISAQETYRIHCGKEPSAHGICMNIPSLKK